jgi:hypothetical protein
MRKSIWIITVILFFIWILPLGVFVLPSREKMFCGGKRAICLCSHLITKQAAKQTRETVYKGSAETQKEHNGPGGANHHFLLIRRNNPTHQYPASHIQQQAFFYSLLVCRSVEHVPRA